MGRLIVDVSSEQHQIIKALAATEGKTIKDYILEKVLPVKDESNLDDAWDELRDILAKRIENAQSKGASTKSISQITEATLNRLERSD